MIELENIYKSYRTYSERKHVLKGISLRLPSDCNLGILGRNGAGKTTLIRILSRLELPDSGSISHGSLRLSWPIGRGGVRSALSGRDNVRFVCRVYGLDVDRVTDFVEDFSELGNYLDMPVSTYSAGMRSRLAFSISMACEFDCYLVDEGFSAGDARFTKRMNDLFEQRRTRSNMIVVSHNAGVIRRFCNVGAVLEDGQLTIYRSLDEALAVYQNL